MSVENGKVCCNCRHCKRIKNEWDATDCYCEVDGNRLCIYDVLEGWCRHWAKDKEVQDGNINS